MRETIPNTVPNLIYVSSSVPCLLSINCYKNSVYRLMLFSKNKRGDDEWLILLLKNRPSGR